MNTNMHSVTLDKDACKGCTTCLKQCPTGAIRIRRGKAKIIKERCIDCGECIRVCPYHAKKATTDRISVINEYKYKVALPAPSMYVQFEKEYSVDTVLTALLEIGFDDVFEVAAAAEIISDASRKLFLSGELQTPVISSACPVILRLLMVRFPSLIANIIPVQAPVDVAARLARERAVEKTGLKPEEIGVFFISPCPAKATTVKMPIGIKETNLNGVIAMKDVCLEIAKIISKITEPKKLATAGLSGIGWAKSEGETKALGKPNSIAVDGIANCINLLEKMEDNCIHDVDFVELSACTGGCVGGVLNVENPYIAKNKLSRVTEKITEDGDIEEVALDDILWTAPVAYRPVMNLDTNIITAMKKMAHMEEIYKNLPHLDCGACGSPSCRTFAEDIVRGFADETDCTFKLREKVHNLAFEMMDLERRLSPSLHRDMDKTPDESDAEKDTNTETKDE